MSSLFKKASAVTFCAVVLISLSLTGMSAAPMDDTFPAEPSTPQLAAEEVAGGGLGYEPSGAELADSPVSVSESAVPIAPAAEEFRIEVFIPYASRSFWIPTSGQSGGFVKSYDWDIDWGDGASNTGYTESINPDGNQPSENGPNENGIKHEYAAAGTYVITITPGDSADAWLGSFGFNATTGGGTANQATNREYLTDILSPFTPLMTRNASALPAGAPPDGEWYATFKDCSNLKSTGPGFSSAWSGITGVGDDFARQMFRGSSSAQFVMRPSFNLPQNLMSIGDDFANDMFSYSSGADFNMNDVFNLPQTPISVGDAFAKDMFYGCRGTSFMMNDVFTLPPGITAVGEGFAAGMFGECSGDAFTMGWVFNLPQGLTSVEPGFAQGTFFYCIGTGFMVNDVFSFPRLSQSELDKADVFNGTFSNLSGGIVQKRSAVSIINNPSTVTPPTMLPFEQRHTFGSSNFPDIDIIDSNWAGNGNLSDCVVTFDSNGASQVSFTSESVGATSTALPAVQGVRIGTPAVAYSSSYTNHTWYTDPDNLYPWDIENDVIPLGTAAMTLYAFKPAVPVNYTVLEHFGTWTGSDTAAARIDAEPAKFLGLYLSGMLVPPAGYDITTGSTVITLKESYLKTFVNGDYVFTAEYTDGTATPINLKVAVAGGTGQNGGDPGPNGGAGAGLNGAAPDTGDSGGVLFPLMGALFGLSLLAFAALPRKQKAGR